MQILVLRLIRLTCIGDLSAWCLKAFSLQVELTDLSQYETIHVWSTNRQKQTKTFCDFTDKLMLLHHYCCVLHHANGIRCEYSSSMSFSLWRIPTCITGKIWIKSSPWIWWGSRRWGHFIFGRTETIFSVRALQQDRKHSLLLNQMILCNNFKTGTVMLK